jgi:hypothetical protein
MKRITFETKFHPSVLRLDSYQGSGIIRFRNHIHTLLFSYNFDINTEKNRTITKGEKWNHIEMDSCDKLFITYYRIQLHSTIKYLTLKEYTIYLVPVFHGLLQKQLGENTQMESPRDGNTTART